MTIHLGWYYLTGPELVLGHFTSDLCILFKIQTLQTLKFRQQEIAETDINLLTAFTVIAVKD